MGSQQLTCITSTMKLLLALATLALVVLSMVEGFNLSDIEEMAFEICDSDGDAQLSWQEVEACEAIYAGSLTLLGLNTPTEEDFNKMDVNGDGQLSFGEWEQNS